MFLNNLSHEIKLLFRSQWLLVLCISTTLLFAFAAFNGNKNVEKRLKDISKVTEVLQIKDSIMLSTLSKIKKGEVVDGPNWRLPSDPMTIGYRHPRLAIMNPNEFSFIATGQSDMYTHFKSPTIYGNNFALDYSEMINPVQLLFGNFDLAFVLIYILPLLIISFTFNVLSKEKELGTLRLLSAQPLSMINWLLQKTAIRFLIFTLICVVSIFIVIAIFSPNSLKDGFSMLGLLALLFAYNLFWFVLSFLVNIKVNNSAKNALTLIGLWLLIVLILPASINQIGNSLYPVPSRLKMINEIRLIKKENAESQNKIMDEYLRNHPELAQQSGKDNFGFWHNYFASEKVMEEKTKPILVEYESQLKKQQDLISLFKYLSPAILVQQSLNNFAGTSEKHYNDYKKQVFEFSDKWRNYLAPMLFKNQKFTIKNYNEMPVFNYNNRIKNNIWLSVIILIFTNALVFFLFNMKSLKNKSAQEFMD